MTKPASMSTHTDPLALERAALDAGGRQLVDKRNRVNKTPVYGGSEEDNAPGRVQVMQDERGAIRTLNNNKHDAATRSDIGEGKPSLNSIREANVTIKVPTTIQEASSLIVDKHIRLQDPRMDSPDTEGHQFVVMAIHSRVTSISRRTVIRNTWLSMTHNASLIYWFVIGGRSADESTRLDLREEQDRYNDLLIFWDIDNNYHSLTTRSLQTMVHITANYHFNYYLKTDDDMFLNLPLVLRELETRSRTRLYLGRFSCHNPPLERGRWRETLWNSCDVYFPYAYGGLYIITSDLVTLVANQAPHLKLYTCEDVSIGSWLALYNIERVNDARIYIQHSDQCGRGYIAVHINHQLAHKQIRKFYSNLRSKGAICSNPVHEELLSWEDLPLACTSASIVLI